MFLLQKMSLQNRKMRVVTYGTENSITSKCRCKKIAFSETAVLCYRPKQTMDS